MNLAIIGGTGALRLFPGRGDVAITTPFGAPSARPCRVEAAGREVWFLARHGDPHRIPPHRINYRANVHALRSVGAEAVVGINAVGAVSPELEPGSLLLPDQLVDQTWGRAHTFSDGGSAPLRHIDFTRPFDGPLRQALLDAAATADMDIADGGCVAVTQGPRLETAAEVEMLAAQGCDVIGMTAMPEAALAREAGLDYASLCVVANAAAGRSAEAITEREIHATLDGAMDRVRRVLEALIAAWPEPG